MKLAASPSTSGAAVSVLAMPTSAISSPPGDPHATRHRSTGPLSNLALIDQGAGPRPARPPLRLRALAPLASSPSLAVLGTSPIASVSTRPHAVTARAALW
jgi:hypothetical protein